MADPLVLANLMDGVVNVTQSGRFSRKMIGRSIDLLDGVNANVLGIVLNEVKERDHRYYYYYRYKYYYRYSEDGDGEKGKDKPGNEKPKRKRKPQRSSSEPTS